MKRESSRIQKARAARGQALFAGTALMMVLTGLAVSLLIVLANICILGNLSERLHGAASETAERIATEEYQLGLSREHDPTAINATASSYDADSRLLRAEMDAMGVNPNLMTNFHVAVSDSTLNDVPVKTYKVSFDIWGVPMFGGTLPALFPMHITGSSTDYSEHAEEMHGFALILVVDPDHPNYQRGIRVPIYNATIGRNTPADPVFLHMGKLVGEPPVAYMRVNCPNNGLVIPPSRM